MRGRCSCTAAISTGSTCNAVLIDLPCTRVLSRGKEAGCFGVSGCVGARLIGKCCGYPSGLRRTCGGYSTFAVGGCDVLSCGLNSCRELRHDGGSGSVGRGHGVVMRRLRLLNRYRARVRCRFGESLRRTSDFVIRTCSGVNGGRVRQLGCGHGGVGRTVVVTSCRAGIAKARISRVVCGSFRAKG